ncbi:4-diphosphocytidyl-2c-methyl-d-erythritol kinase [Nitzschia inconspicua]|uniref:4-(cytidine 5'-diphospho)-2-C-methyl-D-erythritol kinase n=1 Tax=Nitzschia inconspicua TaxID=303405 RepID=A0A9K3L5L3_9STRA|nr:4-diphosphocytidyl-2c-methyl-d-erythritol kinase [Nitzschia inconspicua]
MSVYTSSPRRFLSTIYLLFVVLVCYCCCTQVHGFSRGTVQWQSVWKTTTTTSTVTTQFATLSSTSSQESSTAASDTLTLFSPCKINLFLRILRKREDGYHDLASLFQAIGFGDTLELTTTNIDQDKDAFTCNMPGVPVDDTNLVLRALQLMRNKTGVQQYFQANLIKQVPAQAGLGGGSANAATAMWASNELMGRPATLEQMIEWSGELGSDITFFLSRGTAYCTGRGEIMTPTEPPLPTGTKLCIVKPNIGLSTPSVFKELNYDELSELDADNVLLPAFLNANGVENVPSEYYVNDLEPPAFRCVPELGELKAKLQKVPGFKHVMMSGSGTSIFCIGEPDDNEAFRKEFEDDNERQVFFSEFISRNEGEWFQRP